MKIRRKPPKLSRSGRPLYVIGYSFSPPQLAELQAWFDLEYGGPITFKEGTADSAVLALAAHGPWHAAVQMELPSAEAGLWKDRLGWEHPKAGLVLPTSAAGKTIDLILLASRLARGLTLLTEGTAYDVSSQQYRNPSDWKDRRLDRFNASDHIVVDQIESGDSGLERFYTRGLTKFGLDELETFRPVGLTSSSVLDNLVGIAEELIQVGRSPKVGTTFEVQSLRLVVQVVRHRTTTPSEGSVPVREIVWPGPGGKA